MRLVAVGALVIALGVAGQSEAWARPKPRVAVVGPGTDGVVVAVRRALARRVQLVQVRGGARNVVATATAHRLDAVVKVSVTNARQRGRMTSYGHAVVSVFQGRDGKRLARYKTSGHRRRLARATARKAWPKLSWALRRARRPEARLKPKKVVSRPARVKRENDGARRRLRIRERAPLPPPKAPVAAEPVVSANEGGSSVEPTASATPSVTRAAPARPGASPIELSVDGRAFVRTLRYRDDLFDALRTYELGAPAAGITAGWRPFRGARFLSLRGELELAMGVNGSRTPDGMQYATSASEWSAGLRADVSIKNTRVALDVAYGEHRFTVEGDLIPDVTYRWARGALTIMVPVTASITVAGGAGWRHLLSSGQLASSMWFPRASGAGIDAELGLTWRAAESFSLFVRGDLRRYFFAMNPEPGDPQIAGGAIDQYLAIIAGASMSFGGR